MLEAIIGLGRQALHQQDIGFGEPVQRHLQRRYSISATARSSV